MTRFLLTADLHQFIPKWEQLVEATLRERPDFLLIAGDLLPKTTHAAQREFFPEMRRYLTRMKDEAGTRGLLGCRWESRTVAVTRHGLEF